MREISHTEYSICGCNVGVCVCIMCIHSQHLQCTSTMPESIQNFTPFLCSNDASGTCKLCFDGIMMKEIVNVNTTAGERNHPRVRFAACCVDSMVDSRLYGGAFNFSFAVFPKSETSLTS